MLFIWYLLNFLDINLVRKLWVPSNLQPDAPCLQFLQFYDPVRRFETWIRLDQIRVAEANWSRPVLWRMNRARQARDRQRPPETVRDRRLRRLIVECLWKFSQSWPIVDFAFCVVLQLFCKLHLQQWKCQPGFSEPNVSVVTVLVHEGQTESLYWLKNHKSQKMCKAKRWLILLKVFLLRSMEWRVWPRFSPWRHGLNGCFVWHLNTPNLERDRQGGIR